MSSGKSKCDNFVKGKKNLLFHLGTFWPILLSQTCPTSSPCPAMCGGGESCDFTKAEELIHLDTWHYRTKRKNARSKNTVQNGRPQSNYISTSPPNIDLRFGI